MSLLGWMAYAFVVSALVSGGAWCLDRTLLRAHFPVRWIWVGAIGLSAGLALAAPFGHRPEAAVDAPASMPSTSVSVPEAGTSGTPAIPWPIATFDRAVTALDRAIAWGAHPLPSGPVAERLTLASWMVGSIALGMLVLVSGALMARRRRRWAHAQIRRRPVRIAPDVGPAVIGLIRPEIVLPSWAVGLDGDDLDLILAHEDEHLRARDPLLLAGALLPVLAFPWNPAVWWQLRRLRDAVEIDCDRRVLRRGALPIRYGRMLVRMRGEGRSDLLPAAALAGSPSLLERRLNAMKKTSVRTTIPLALLGAIAAVSLLVLACEADPPTRPADEAVEAAIPDQTAENLPLVVPDQVGGDRPLIVVDGVIVSTGFDDLEPESIEQVEVVKGAAAFERYGSRAQHGVIQITTRDGAGATQDPAALEDSAVLDAEEGATPVISGDVVVDRRGTTYHVLGGTVEGARVRSGDDASPQVLLRDAGRDGSRDDEFPQILLRDAVREGFEEGDRPLLIVDGVIVDDETASEIAPQGIASVEIVKGAAAAHLYGTRAANGVIQITTRR